MIKNTRKPFKPDVIYMKILCLMSQGYSQKATADLLGIKPPAVRWRVGNLIEKLGLNHRYQMMYAYGSYLANHPGKALLAKCAEGRLPNPPKQHCQNCPKGNPVQELKEFVESLCGK